MRRTLITRMTGIAALCALLMTPLTTATANAAPARLPAAPQFAEIGAVPVPDNVRADLSAALTRAEQQRAAQPSDIQAQQVCYAVSISNHPNNGWTSAECNTTILGDYHNQIEAIEMVVSPDVGEVGYDTHIENIGWQGYRYNGAMAGTVGSALRMEAFRAWLVGSSPDHHINYNVYLPDFNGWQRPAAIDGQVAGTTGASEPITALWINVN